MFFCEDINHSAEEPYKVFELWQIIEQLHGTRFKIDRDTDYVELAATISILDIAIDNGLSASVDLTDVVAENNFNANVDALGARIRDICYSINDAGAAFISRIDAKEVMEGVRHRLIYTVRTRTKPKQGVFDDTKAERRSIESQAAFMQSHIKRFKTIEDSKLDTHKAIASSC
jgi:hypothetical protein